MPTAYLGLGSNQGDRARHLRAAVRRLHRRDGLRVTGASPVYETEAHTAAPNERRPPFLNAVLRVEADRSPEALLRVALAVERQEGRTRPERGRWPPRPLDIDLLVVGDATRQTDRLTLPHPRLDERRFVLRPWADLAPNLAVPPPFDAPVRTLLQRCPDTAALERTSVSLAVPASNGPSPA